ncbi:MAG: hypothetical protein RMM29_07000 [Planctomycetota bacterium]|nr:hypothetical protein [Planctomycetota bacterium]MCX8040319.1 hypothetical protein [Planctomycetota bacterium]MDW8373377.1 hypothetical protein [Planctomycetota bacterium]
MRALSTLASLSLIALLALGEPGALSAADADPWPAPDTIVDDRPGIVRYRAIATAGDAEHARQAALARAIRALAQARRVQVTARTTEDTWERTQEQRWGSEFAQQTEMRSEAAIVGLRTRGERQRRVANGVEVDLLVEVDEDEIFPHRALQRASQAATAAERCRALLELLAQRWNAGRCDLAAVAADAAVRQGDDAGPPWRARARWERARLRAELGRYQEALDDLSALREDPAAADDAQAQQRLQREIERQARTVAEIPALLAQLAQAAHRPQRFSVEVVPSASAVEVRWQLHGEEAVFVMFIADERELMVCEPRGSQPLSGSGSLRFARFPARVWCWALAPDSQVLAAVRAMRHPRIALRGELPVSARLEWHGLLQGLRRAAQNRLPPPAVAWELR